MDTAGAQWIPDYAYSAGATYSTTSAIANTTDDALYQSERSGTFNYAIPVPDGDYTVALKFAELHYTAAGQRVFGVSLEGTAVLSNFDVYAEAGARYAAVDRTFTVSVTDGVLNVDFTKVTGDPIICAIGIVRNISGGNLLTSYQYSADGLRQSKTEGGVTTTYTWDVNASLPVILQDGSQTYVYGLGLVSQTDGSGDQVYPLGDGLGSTTTLTDSTGTVVATYAYDVFGALRSSTGTADTEYRFMGQQDDATLGYTYLRARYYDPLPTYRRSSVSSAFICGS